MEYPHQDLTECIIGHAIDIHKKLGPGLLESVYQKVLVYELQKAGLEVRSEVEIPLVWDGKKMDAGFRADIMINNVVLLELKSVETTAPVHRKQLLTYLRIAGLKVGLLINFGEVTLSKGLHRIVN